MNQELPKWIDSAMLSSCNEDRIAIRKALEIAWEALEALGKGNRSPGVLDISRVAMREIEELGK